MILQGVLRVSAEKIIVTKHKKTHSPYVEYNVLLQLLSVDKLF